MFAVLLCCVLGLGGCGGAAQQDTASAPVTSTEKAAPTAEDPKQEEKDSKDAKAPAQEPPVQEPKAVDEHDVAEAEKSVVEIDTPEAAGDVVPNATVTVNNQTGYDVVSLALRASGTQDYDEAHTFNDLLLVDGSTAQISFQQITDGGEPVAFYDVLLVTADDSIMEMYNVDLLNLRDLTLRFEDSVGYVEYLDEDTGQTTDNKDESMQVVIDQIDDLVTYDMENQK